MGCFWYFQALIVQTAILLVNAGKAYYDISGPLNTTGASQQPGANSTQSPGNNTGIPDVKDCVLYAGNVQVLYFPESNSTNVSSGVVTAVSDGFTL